MPDKWYVRLWRWIRLHWKFVATVALAIVGALVAKRIIEELVGLIVGKVKSPLPWQPLDATHVAVKTAAGWKSVDVARLGLRTDQVGAVGLAQGGGAEVEVLHEVVDRRSVLGSGGINGGD